MNSSKKISALPTYESLLADPDLYESFIYSDLEDARQQLQLRKNDSALDAYLQKVLPNGPPDPMKENPCTVLFRHVATPNFEAQRFEMLASMAPDLDPVILEYSKDMFTNRNGWKFAMVKLRFDNGLSKTNERIVQFKTILNINASNTKEIYSLKTYWGESLIDFHHQWFDSVMEDIASKHVDISIWLKHFGPTAKDYYKSFLALFLKHGILFEYFLLHGEEEPFTKEIILPALLEIYKETGYRPLIVRLQPKWSEGDSFWLSYPFFYRGFIDEKAAMPHNI